MTLYEIDTAIMDCFDAETGELTNPEAFENLQVERSQKIENIACWIKDLVADAAAIREEEKALAERRKVMENKAANLKDYLSRFVNPGEKYSSARCAVSWRKSTKVEIFDLEALLNDSNMDQYLVYKEPEPNKKLIKEAIQDGQAVTGCELVDAQNLQIK